MLLRPQEKGGGGQMISRDLLCALSDPSSCLYKLQGCRLLRNAWETSGTNWTNPMKFGFGNLGAPELPCPRKFWRHYWIISGGDSEQILAFLVFVSLN